MNQPGLFQAAAMLAVGVFAQVVAARLGIPAIVLLLSAGVLLGPDVAGLLDPRAFGDGRGDLVTLGVTIILFEGALGLDRQRLRAEQRSLMLLLTVGALITFVGATLAAEALLDLSFGTAAVYGALMIVTGPTVVTPLLARLRLDRRVRELLVSEGVLVDPLGAVAAIVAVEVLVGQQALAEAGWLIAARLGIGAALGFVAAVAIAVPLRRRWIPEFLVAPSVLASALLVASGANTLSPEAGLMSAVAQGVTLANLRIGRLGRLREFKERVGVLALSFLFVFLATDLRLEQILELGWAGLAVPLVLMWVVRPLAVAASTWGSELGRRERAFVAWICPRGIVAAAVAGLFRIVLEDAGLPGGRELEALVFVTVAVTVTVQGLSAGAMARWLRVDFPSLRETLVVGADALGVALARSLMRQGRRVVLIDRSPWLCNEARLAGLEVMEGDALSTAVLEEAGALRADTVVALTRNPELNSLVLGRIRDHFQIERRLAVLAEGEDESHESGPLHPFPGRFPGVDVANAALRSGTLKATEQMMPKELSSPRRLDRLVWSESAFALALVRSGNAVVATEDLEVAQGDLLVGISRDGAPLVVGFGEGADEA